VKRVDVERLMLLGEAQDKLVAREGLRHLIDHRRRGSCRREAASAGSACWAMQTSRHARQQSNTDQQISFRNR
jgi:hypothetical protein